MFQALRQMFARGEELPPPAVPAGERVYAVGDVHGRLDLFAALVEAIDADDAAAGPAVTTGSRIPAGPRRSFALDARMGGVWSTLGLIGAVAG